MPSSVVAHARGLVKPVVAGRAVWNSSFANAVSGPVARPITVPRAWMAWPWLSSDPSGSAQARP